MIINYYILCLLIFSFAFLDFTLYLQNALEYSSYLLIGLGSINVVSTLLCFVYENCFISYNTYPYKLLESEYLINYYINFQEPRALLNHLIDLSHTNSNINLHLHRWYQKPTFGSLSKIRRPYIQQNQLDWWKTSYIVNSLLNHSCIIDFYYSEVESGEIRWFILHSPQNYLDGQVFIHYELNKAGLINLNEMIVCDSFDKLYIKNH